MHFLGDTQLRMRELFAVSMPTLTSGVAGVWSWIEAGSRILHAGPLDMVVDVLPVVVLHAQGFTVSDAVAIVTAILALGISRWRGGSPAAWLRIRRCADR